LEIKECVDDILERNHIIVGKDALIKQLKLYKDTQEIREHNRKLIMDQKKFSDLNLQEFTRAREYLARY